jgi:hypothetical protein
LPENGTLELKVEMLSGEGFPPRKDPCNSSVRSLPPLILDNAEAEVSALARGLIHFLELATIISAIPRHGHVVSLSEDVPKFKF